MPYRSILRGLRKIRIPCNSPARQWRGRFHTVASTSIFQSKSATVSSRPVTLPTISELNDKNFLDVLIPPTSQDAVKLVDYPVEAPATNNPMMDVLKATAATSHQTYTDNGAPAYSSTLSSTLDAFTGISRYTIGQEVGKYLTNSWNEDPALTLRLIWNLRSIHDGRSEREAFYRAFGWLYDNHPRTAISNLHLLVEPVCHSKKKVASHGYWKDLLNILALATVDELSNTMQTSYFLHTPRIRAKAIYYDPNETKTKLGTPELRIALAKIHNDKVKAEAAARRKAKQLENHLRLLYKLTDSKYRALYIAVARLFADQLIKDVQVLGEIENLQPGGDRITLLKKISLAGKWAPTPNGSHDRVTNISTAISDLMHLSQTMKSYPSALNNPLLDQDRAIILRSFYQRWVLTQLRAASSCTEPLMSSNRWKEIKYNRVPSICMKNNTPHFFKHDPEGFEAYLTSVENNKKSISGATIMPHELVAQIVSLDQDASYSNGEKNTDPMKGFKKKLAKTQLRVVEAQWKTLIDHLRESGSIENSLAICDVSGSMGHFKGKHNKRNVQPILPAVSLSLILTTLAKPPFNGGFLTFSANPQFLKVDFTKSLAEQLYSMSDADWGMNTNLQTVFLDLLLPLAVKNKVKQEDMIKRLFIFSDMQFDNCQYGEATASVQWATNYDKIERAYKEAGYEVPQIVYWDLSVTQDGAKTVEVESDRKGVAMMNGFSPSMLKVFMGDVEQEEPEPETVSEKEENAAVTEKEKIKEVFNPLNVMKKALMRPSFNGLVIVD